MIPQPPGNDSACRAGNGFQISNTRKSIKPTSKYFQLRTSSNVSNAVRMLAAPPGIDLSDVQRTQLRKIVRCWPETSSITTRCGSLVSQNCEAFPAVQTPI